MKTNQLWRILFLTAFWILSAAFIITYERVIIVQELESQYGINANYDLPGTLSVAILVALLAGAIIGTFEVLYLGRVFRKKPLGLTLFLKTTFYLCSIFFFSSLAVLLIISQRTGLPITESSVQEQLAMYLVSPRVVLVTAYWGIAVALALFILEVNDKFGQGVLVNFLRGKYHQPREEIRIFMFLDLTSSTTYGERLGHLKYSRLLQDCFGDLTDVVIRNHAQIYQYVGDEVVLTWKREEGVKDYRCLALFFDYDRVLRERKDYYRRNYGIQPEFKAGLNLGRITVAEVGEIKRELAYHRDTLNTAARIRSACGPMQRRVLASGELLQTFPHLSKEFLVDRLEPLRLKGKNHPVPLWSIEQRPS